MPAELGSATPSAAAVAIAASTALPPWASTSRPILDEYGLTLETTPPVPVETAVGAGNAARGVSGAAGPAHAVVNATQQATAIRARANGLIRPP